MNDKARLTPPQISLLKRLEGMCADNYKPMLKLKELMMIDVAHRFQPGSVHFRINSNGKAYLESMANRENKSK